MSTRDTMLGLAREAILHRAKADGYQPKEYDPDSDPEGYVTSLLTALCHWCEACGHDWNAELRRAQELFEDDLAELRPSEVAPE
ncbi:MAG: hypothetical protein IT365_04545 [Candidatus Hydrogenedentes bacterium]|nr:hypothetical protein [Candidatus Hydrogenedentota bacterium]